MPVLIPKGEGVVRSVSCGPSVPEHLGLVKSKIVLKPDDVADYLASFYLWKSLSGFILPTLNFLQ